MEKYIKNQIKIPNKVSKIFEWEASKVPYFSPAFFSAKSTVFLKNVLLSVSNKILHEYRPLFIQLEEVQQ